MNVYITLAVIAVVVFAAMNLIGFIWAHHKARQDISPIIED